MTDIRDFINTTGAEELRTMMRFDTDPRWHDRPVEPPPSPTRRSKIVARWCALMIVGGIVLPALATCMARGAESADHMRPHEITLLLPLPPADQPVPDVPYIITISGAYDDKAACEKAKQGVRVAAGKVVCSIVNPWRVR